MQLLPECIEQLIWCMVGAFFLVFSSRWCGRTREALGAAGTRTTALCPNRGNSDEEGISLLQDFYRAFMQVWRGETSLPDTRGNAPAMPTTRLAARTAAHLHLTSSPHPTRSKVELASFELRRPGRGELQNETLLFRRGHGRAAGGPVNGGDLRSQRTWR